MDEGVNQWKMGGGVCLRNPFGYDWDLHQEKNQIAIFGHCFD